MLDSKGFDTWAGEYDESIERYSNGYPFEGYYNVLECIRKQINSNEKLKILDVGIGTGLLSYELYKEGHDIYGIDFSTEMLNLASKKMPKSTFYQHDFNNGIPQEMSKMKFDYIISSYAIHHLNDSEKVNFIVKLKDILKENGKIIIGDIAFKTRKELEDCKSVTSGWDESEIYFISEEMIESLNKKELQAQYVQISSCAGVLSIS